MSSTPGRLHGEHHGHTAASTLDRVARDLTHEAFPLLAAAMRARIQPVLDQWRRLSFEAMPHLDEMTQKEFEDSVGLILSAAADAFESADPAHLRGVVEQGPEHGFQRFMQKYNLLDLFEEVRILRGVVIVEVATEMGRPLAVGESATFHAIFDIIGQQGVMAMVALHEAEAHQWHETMRDLNEHLLVSSTHQHELTERAEKAEAALQVQARLLERTNADLLQFAGAASHDLKEPLRGISWLTGFVVEDEPGLSEESRQRLGRIGELCERLSRMIGGLIDYARTGVQPNLERCDLSEVIARVTDNISETLSAQGVMVKVAPDLPTIRADCVLMERVFANLIANGIKFNDSAAKRIDIFWDDERRAIAVRDNGIGIDQRQQDKLFKLYNRLHSSRRYPGDGIGLALARRIVEAHAGSIEFESAAVPGQGTTFYMHLPLTREEHVRED
jgi:signal transduction histidine kinase